MFVETTLTTPAMLNMLTDTKQKGNTISFHFSQNLFKNFFMLLLEIYIVHNKKKIYIKI